MSEREAFERIVASLHEVALDHARWSSASALIDEALGAHGSSMVVGDGDCAEDIQIYSCVGRSSVGDGSGKWSASTSRSTTPWTNGSRACGISPTASCSTSPISTPRRN